MLTKEDVNLQDVTHIESSNKLGLVSICKNNIKEKDIKLVM